MCNEISVSPSKKRKEKKIQTEESEAERDTFVKIDWLVSSSTA